MRVCAVEDVPGADQTAIQEHSTCTSGIVVRNGPEIRMTVSNKAFGNYNSVSHSLDDRARQSGIIEERYQDLNVALVRLAPEVQEKASNRSYFQAEVPEHMITGDSVVQGSWYEVGGMSTGLMTLYNIGRTIEYPTGSASDTRVDVSQ